MSFSVRQVGQHVVPDRVHQVRLAESDAAVDEQRVVRARRRFGDRAAGGMRELVRRSDDERVERIAGREAARRIVVLGVGVDIGGGVSEAGAAAGDIRGRHHRAGSAISLASVTNAMAVPFRSTSASASSSTAA